MSLENVGDVLARLAGCYLSNLFEFEASAETAWSLQQAGVYGWGIRDLFIIQIILDQDKFALLLWREGRDHVGTALMASICLDELSKLALRNDKAALAEPLLKRSETWLMRAVDTMSHCADIAPQSVRDVLTRALPTWQQRTVLDIAHYGKRRRFIQHPAVMSKLSKIWCGQIASFTPPKQIYMTMLLPIPLIFFMYFEVRTQRKTYRTSRFGIEDSEDDGDDVSMVEGPKLKKVVRRPTIFGNKDTYQPSMFKALFYFYTSPVVKCLIHSAAYLAFLFIFTAFLLGSGFSRFEAGRLHESIVLVWSIALLADSFHETIFLDFIVFLQQNSSDTKAFISETWRRFLRGCYSALIFDMFAETLLFTAFILRRILTPEDNIYPATLYAVACLLFWLKCLRLFYLSKELGTLVVTLNKIVPVLLQFLLLYLVLLAAFAPPLFALANPNFDKYEDGHFLPVFLDVIYKRWWNLVGNSIDTTRTHIEQTCPSAYTNAFHLETTSPEPITSDCQSDDSILGRNFIAALMFVSYLWVTNVTWMTMLIASLNQAIETTRMSAIEFWSFNYYFQVRTWYHRYVSPAPFSIVEMATRLLVFVIRRKPLKTSQLRKYLNEYENLQIDELERTAVDLLLDKENVEVDENKDKTG